MGQVGRIAMSRTARIGEVFTIPLGDGRVGFGQVVAQDALRAIDGSSCRIAVR